jgi:glycosyltransferase involved in cell wall biosynthesis
VTDHKPTTLWVDIDDLLHYLAHHSRPSGIQRVTFEICAALHRDDAGAGRVGFVRRDGGPRDLVTLPWQDVAAIFDRLANPDAPVRRAQSRTRSIGDAIARLRRPVGGTRPWPILGRAAAAQGLALLQLARLPFATATASAQWARQAVLTRAARAARQRAMAASRSRLLAPGRPLAKVASPGDTLLVLGSPWAREDYVRTVRWVRDELRMRFALLVHDLIPLRRPEWCDRNVTRGFVDWHRAVLPFADQIFSNSRATATDVSDWTRANGIVLTNPVQPVPIGTGLGIGSALGPAEAAAPAETGPSPDLPSPGSYVLFVSTLEARKNHVLLFRVWRRLLSDLPRDAVPTLVFAGRVGWLVSDLMQQLENARWLDGKICMIHDPTDTELAALYRGCRFTLFPSLHEGWGLPISESLAQGRPCLASNRTSLPEAGGDLARYFDPDNLADAYRAVRAVIDDPAGLEAWRQRVAREFRPVAWAQSAAVIHATLDALTRAEAVGGSSRPRARS